MKKINGYKKNMEVLIETNWKKKEKKNGYKKNMEVLIETNWKK